MFCSFRNRIQQERKKIFEKLVLQTLSAFKRTCDAMSWETRPHPNFLKLFFKTEHMSVLTLYVLLSVLILPLFPIYFLFRVQKLYGWNVVHVSISRNALQPEFSCWNMYLELQHDSVKLPSSGWCRLSADWKQCEKKMSPLGVVSSFSKQLAYKMQQPSH